MGDGQNASTNRVHERAYTIGDDKRSTDHGDLKGHRSGRRQTDIGCPDDVCCATTSEFNVPVFVKGLACDGFMRRVRERDDQRPTGDSVVIT